MTNKPKKFTSSVECSNPDCEVKPSFLWTPLKDYFSSKEASFQCSYCGHCMHNTIIEEIKDA